MGLADGLGGLDYVAREVIKAEKVVDFSPRENYFEQLTERFGVRAGDILGRAFAEAIARSTLGVR